MAHRSCRIAIVRVLISCTLARRGVHHFGARSPCKRTTRERRSVALTPLAMALSDSILDLKRSGLAHGPAERLLQFAFAFSTGPARQ